MTTQANVDGENQETRRTRSTFAVTVALPRRSFNTPSFRPPWSVLSCTARTVLTRSAQAAQQSQSIQTLLEAEKEAAKVVTQARQCMCTNLSHRDAAHIVA